MRWRNLRARDSCANVSYIGISIECRLWQFSLKKFISLMQSCSTRPTNVSAFFITWLMSRHVPLISEDGRWLEIRLRAAVWSADKMLKWAGKQAVSTTFRDTCCSSDKTGWTVSKCFRWSSQFKRRNRDYKYLLIFDSYLIERILLLLWRQVEREDHPLFTSRLHVIVTGACPDRLSVSIDAIFFRMFRF